MGCSSARGLPGLFSTIWRGLGYPTLRPAPSLFDRNAATSDADSKAAEGDDYSIDNPEQLPIWRLALVIAAFPFALRNATEERFLPLRQRLVRLRPNRLH